MKELLKEYFRQCFKYPVYSTRLFYTIAKNSVKYNLSKSNIVFPKINTVLIETDNRCNRRCRFCPVCENPKQPNTMSLRLYHKIIHELSDLDFSGRLGLFLYNEPLLDKRLSQLVRYAKDNLPKCSIMISVNGDFLTLDHTKTLFENGLSYIWVRQYDETVSKHIEQIYTKLSLMEKQHFIISTFKDFTNTRLGLVEVSTKVNPKISDICFKPFYELCIFSDGTVPLCCNDYFPKSIMGNLNHNTIREVWGCDKFQYYRKELSKGGRGFSGLCRECTDPSAKLIY